MARGPEWDEAEFQAWFRDPNGPVMRDLMPRLGARTAASARSRYHRITGNTAGSIHYETGCDSQGPYCNVGGSYVITFLEHPAKQMHSPHRWLSDAVREIAGALSRTTEGRDVTRVAGKSPANGAADTAAAAEKAARKVQAKTSGAKSGDTVTWKGETFRLESGDLPGAATMIMTHMGVMDPSVRDPDAEDGMYQILEMCLAQPSGPQPGDPGFDVETYDPGEFKRFMRHAARTRASLEEIVEALTSVVEVYAARPTARRPGSSGGQPATTANSTGTSSGTPGEASSG